MKRFIITLIILFVALAAAAATVKFRWAPIFGPKNDHLYDQVGLIIAVLGLIVMFITLLVSLKQLKQNQSSKNSTQAGRDVNQTEGNIQTGGITTHAPVGGDVVGGDNIEGDKVEGNKIVYEAPHTTPPSPLYQLRRPPDDFVGRTAELKELLGKLQNGGISISGLRGMGGIGKTALALVLAAQLAPAYPDGQFYLDLKGTKDDGAKPLTPGEAMAHVIRGYNPDPNLKLPEDEAQLQGLYNSVLHGKRALLLMDNALDAAQVKPLIPPDGNVLLITSRQHFTLPGIFAKDLDTLPPEDAKKLLLRIADKIGNHADEIVKLCGYLPIALRLAGSALAEERLITPEEYAKRLAAANSSRLLEFADASLTLSYDLLDGEMQKLWRMLAVFPDSFDSAAAAAVWSIPKENADENLNTLINRSLVDCDETTRRCRLHDLARVFADSHLIDKEERYAAQKRHAMHYLQVLERASNMYEEGWEKVRHGLGLFQDELSRSIALLSADWHSIAFGQSWAADNMSQKNEAAMLCSKYPAEKTGILAFRLSQNERICWVAAALKASKIVRNLELEQKHLMVLGQALCSSGEIERGIMMQKRAIKIADKIGDKKYKAHAQVSLAGSFGQIGDKKNQIELLRQSLDIYKEIQYQRGQAVALAELGHCFRSTGDLEKARDFFRKGIIIGRSTGRKTIEATALGNLGHSYMSIGNANSAVLCYKMALSALEGTGEKWAISNISSALSKAYKLLKDKPLSKEYFIKAIQARSEYIDIRKTTWADSQGTIDMTISLADLYRDEGYLEEALNLMNQVLQEIIQIESPGAEAGARLQKGKILRDLDKEEEASEELLKAFDIWSRLKDIHWEASVAHELGYLYQRQCKRLGDKNNLAKSEFWYRKASELWGRGNEIKSFIEANYQLGIVLVDMGNFKEAEIICINNEHLVRKHDYKLTLAHLLEFKTDLLFLQKRLDKAHSSAEESFRLFTDENALDDVLRVQNKISKILADKNTKN